MALAALQEVIGFRSADMNKSVLSKEDIDKIFRVFRICSDADFSKRYNHISFNRFEMIVREASRLIENIASGRVTVEASALPYIQEFIREFGREYVRGSGGLVYEYTSAAQLAKIKMFKQQCLAAGSVSLGLGRKKGVEPEQKANSRIVKPRSSALSSELSLLKEPSPQKQAGKKHFYSSLNETSGKVPSVVIPENKIARRRIKRKVRSMTFWGRLQNKVSDLRRRTAETARRYGAAVAFLLLGGVGFYAQKNNQNQPVAQEKVCRLNTPMPSSAVVAQNTVLPSATEEKPIRQPQPEKPMPAEAIRPIRVRTVHVPQTEAVAEFHPRTETALSGQDAYYHDFINDLVAQYRKNILILKNPLANRNQLYRSQEALLAKYGKPGYIVRNQSCESMAYATFLNVYEQNRSSDNYVARACRDLLLNVPNPHTCASHTRTFHASYSRNLRAELKDKLKRDPYGIHMVWIYHTNGRLHRQTLVGTGDGKAYLLAYNNNRFVKMNVDNLKKIPAAGGYTADFGGKINEYARLLAAEERGAGRSSDAKLLAYQAYQNQNLRS